MCDLHHDKELNGVHCLPDVAAPSFNIVGMDELRKLHTHVTQEHEIGQVSEQYYTAHLSTSSGASMEDLHPLHYPPILPQDTLFLSTDLQDVDEFVVAENSGLPFEASSLSCLGAPEACLMHQKSHSQEDRHRIVHDPCNQHASAKQQSHVSSSVHVDDDIPTKWSWFNGQCSIKEEPCKGTPSSLLYADQLKGGTFPSSKKLKGMDSTCTKPPLEPIMKWWAQKRRRPENDPLVMLEDCHDAKGDHDDGNRLSPNGQTCRSKHLMTERRRRLKLNERLYSLRALVPTITKMDKASIVGDAIKYVRDLQAQLESTQADVLALQAGNYDPARAELFNCEMEGNDAQCMQFDILQHKMLEMHVSNVEPNIHCLHIICERGKGVLVQLVEALEALDVEIVSASLTSVSDRVLNMIVIKADEVLNSEDLKDMLIRSFLTYGLSL